MWVDDQILLRCEQPLVVDVWVPERPFVVLGNANAIETECHLAHCRVDGVPVMRRYGGGGSVVLHPGCLIVGIGSWVAHFYQNSKYFSQLNTALIHTLQAQWPHLTGLGLHGISDITLDGKKVAGTSLFRSRNYLLYQASLLIEERIDLIERYLPHPSKEPDYRAGKTHREFLSALAAAVPGLTSNVARDLLGDQIRLRIQECLAPDRIAPLIDQIPHLLRKTQQGDNSTQQKTWKDGKSEITFSLNHAKE